MNTGKIDDIWWSSAAFMVQRIITAELPTWDITRAFHISNEGLTGQKRRIYSHS